MHLLVVEDDPRLRSMLERLLEEDRHIVEVAETGEEAVELATAGLADSDGASGLDAIILDVGLPRMSGLDVARHLRERRSRVPILILTARDGIEQRIAGLDAGADDYLVKPFSYAELQARLRAVTRRANRGAAIGTVLALGPIRLDDGPRQVTVNGRRVDLTLREFAVLECLMRHPGQVLSRDQLLDHAWPFGSAVTLNSVDAYIAFLRRKLGASGRLIETVRGVGYRLAADPQPATEVAT
jgi:two-component system, OmpR family, response regulator